MTRQTLERPVAPRALLRHLAVSWLPACLACAAANPDDVASTEANPSTFASDSDDSSDAFEALREASHRVVDGQDVYVVEWDRVLGSEAALRQYHQQALSRDVEKAHVITDAASGTLLVWDASEKNDIAYCVSRDFSPGDRELARSDLARATAAWEAAADVRFREVELPAEEPCSPDAADVDVAVLPAFGMQGACAVPPFIPSDALAGWCAPARQGEILFDYATWPWNMPEGPIGEVFPNIDTIGVMRHELGHLLGLRHEHPWAPNPTCEPQVIAGLGGVALPVGGTEYDQASVMHYPQCGGFDSTDFSITAADAATVRAVYGSP